MSVPIHGLWQSVAQLRNQPLNTSHPQMRLSLPHQRAARYPPATEGRRHIRPACESGPTCANPGLRGRAA